MFSRCITVKLKMDVAKQVPNVIQNDVLPLLRKQKGFRDEIVLTAPYQVKFCRLCDGSTAASAKKAAQANVSAETGATSASAINRRLVVEIRGWVSRR